MADPRAKRRLLSRIAGAVFAVLLVMGFVWFVQRMMSLNANKPSRQIQTVQVIRPPPPPPPDQPPPPPPEKTEEPLPKDQPQPTPDQPDQSPEQPLGIDAEGNAGGDPFGLVGRPGGHDLIGGSGSAPFAWYTNRIRDKIKERLSNATCIKSAKGTLSTRVVVAADGKVKLIKLASGTGNSRIDECVDKELAAIDSIGDAPPPGMPEQVNLRVVL